MTQYLLQYLLIYLFLFISFFHLSVYIMLKKYKECFDETEITMIAFFMGIISPILFLLWPLSYLTRIITWLHKEGE